MTTLDDEVKNREQGVGQDHANNKGNEIKIELQQPHSRFGRRRRGTKKEEKTEIFKDDREPNIRFPLLLMIRIVGWEILWVLIGMVGFACFGAMPHIFNVLMGELIGIVVNSKDVDIIMSL